MNHTQHPRATDVDAIPAMAVIHEAAMTTPAPASTLDLLRGVIAAKQVFWDTLAMLEARVAPTGEFPDATANNVLCCINQIAVAVDNADFVTDAHLDEFLRVMENRP